MRQYELMVILDPDLEERTVAPSLDQFLLREHLKRRGYSIIPSHFEISEGDSDRMQRFVGSEIARLIQLAYNDEGVGAANISKLVNAFGSDMSADDRKVADALKSVGLSAGYDGSNAEFKVRLTTN